jgi:hypothetical protein
VFSLIAGMIDAMKKIVSVGEGFVVALSVEKELVFFERIIPEADEPSKYMLLMGS